MNEKDTEQYNLTRKKTQGSRNYFIEAKYDEENGDRDCET